MDFKNRLVSNLSLYAPLYFLNIFRNRQRLGHIAANILDRLANLCADLKMSLVCGILALCVVAPKLFFCLRSTKEICRHLCAAHMIKDLMGLFQAFFAPDASNIQSAIKPLISMRLEYCEVQTVPHASVFSHACKAFVMLLNLITQKAAALILR